MYIDKNNKPIITIKKEYEYLIKIETINNEIVIYFNFKPISRITKIIENDKAIFKIEDL